MVSATSTVSRSPGLYLHIPFCSAICPYCDFSVLTGDSERKRDFAASLRGELELWSTEKWQAPFDTIYFGGGTPSALSPDLLAQVLQTAAGSLQLATTPWIQFEANPEDTNPKSVQSWRRLGVNSLSLGVQSFDDTALRFLGRRHNGSEARASVQTALGADFDTVSIDLIFGLPDQTLEEWRRDLEIAVSLEPHHISCYQLTIHQGTPFGFRRDRGQFAEMPNDDQAHLFRLTHRFLADHGYPAYEVSNFALSAEPSSGGDYRSRHNQKYWHHTPYLGVGPSAHSFSGSRRWWNERKLPRWQSRLRANERPISGTEELSESELVLEALMLGLRTTQGVDLVDLEAQYGLDLLSRNQTTLERLSSEGLLAVEAARIRPTLDGLAVADSLATALDIPQHPIP